MYEDKILLSERSCNDFLGGLVELPSGSAEPNETIITTLIRKLFEETGLNITDRNIETYLGHFDYKSKSGKNTRQFNFLVRTDSLFGFHLSSEHSNYYLVNPERDTDIYKGLNISKNTREIIEAAMSQL